MRGALGTGVTSSLHFVLGPGELQEEPGQEADTVIQQEMTAARAGPGTGQRGVIRFKVCFRERSLGLGAGWDGILLCASGRMAVHTPATPARPSAPPIPELTRPRPRRAFCFSASLGRIKSKGAKRGGERLDPSLIKIRLPCISL